ncbi:cornifelin homolog A-like [Saccoglossus kowalevskii]
MDTTAITTQPKAGEPKEDVDNKSAWWSSDLFYCVGEMRSCLCGCFFFPCFQCEIAQRMNEAPCNGCCWPCALSSMRTKLRIYQNIEGSILTDALCSTCCGPCVACQISRELDILETQKYHESL